MRTRGVECARDNNNAILIANAFYPKQSRIEGLFIIEPDQENQPQNLIQADSATYEPVTGTWLLERGIRINMHDPSAAEGLGPSIERDYIDEYDFALTPDELVLRRDSQWADLLSLKQLSALLQTNNLLNRPAIDMSRHIRLTQPLVQWVLLLLALPFFLVREPANVMAAGW